MWEKLEQIEKRYEELNQLLALPEVMADQKRVQALAQERAGIDVLVTKYQQYKAVSEELEATKAMRDGEEDGEMAALVKQEIEKLTRR